MAKRTSQHVCQECGAVYGRWQGRCEACGAWNAVLEEASSGSAFGSKTRRQKGAIEFVDLGGDSLPLQRLASGIAEFDRVCGGGLVPGSATLLGGDPGIGKSTLLLQAMAVLATGSPGAGANGAGDPCVYVSGEESIDQVRLRARRMGLGQAPVRLAAATSALDIAASLERLKAPKVVVIDSIQTLFLENLDSAPGTVAQVRASAQHLIAMAKARGFALLLVGHVTKEGLIAGPKVLEHMVDCVLTFEGERGHQFRILRATKNRFGPTDEIGVFEIEMTGQGLQEVQNPSALFLGERDGTLAGSAVFAGLEGTRPLLVEIQALVSPSMLATPRRAVVGWDSGRLAMILAVLEARCGIAFAGKDVYLNVAGGLRITEPAADLAVAAALVSAAQFRAVPAECVVFGEIGLSGEVRAVANPGQRLKEAAKLGFKQAAMPPPGQRTERPRGIEPRAIGHTKELVSWLSRPYLDEQILSASEGSR
jgi:DNA repair protein RadA/Sms